MIEYAWDAGLARVLSDDSVARYAFFVPLAVVAALAFVIVRSVKLQAGVAAISAILPVFWLHVGWPFAALLGPLIAVPAAFGRIDGEDWSEGWVCFGAMGSWSFVWTLVALCYFYPQFRVLLKRPLWKMM